MDVESKNGVIQSSIALLQERFRQLQKEKEMRQRREFLKSTMVIASTSSSSSSSSSDSDSGSENYNFISHRAAATNNDRLKLLFADEVAERKTPPHVSPPPPPHRHHHLVALSLWPVGDVHNNNNNAHAISLRNLRGEKGEEKSKSLDSYGCLNNSQACDDVDTSLRL